MDEPKRSDRPAPPEPPGEGESLEDAAREAVREMERRRDGGGHSGAGDIG